MWNHCEQFIQPKNLPAKCQKETLLQCFLHAQVHHCQISLAWSTATSSYTFNRSCISHFRSSVLLINQHLRGETMLDVPLSSTRLPGCHTISAWIMMARSVLSFEVVPYVLFWHLSLATVYLESKTPAESIATPYSSEKHAYEAFWWSCFAEPGVFKMCLEAGVT